MSRARELSELATAYDSGGGFGFRNRIINGAMVIDQRNAGASVTPTSSTYTLDRWRFGCSQASKVSVQQSTSAPAGFTNSAQLTVGAAANVTVGASDEFWFQQRIEGFNVADMAFGTASAVTFTVSFWVNSSVTGTYAASFQNNATNYSYVSTFTISAANTWEYKTLTIPAPTAGTWTTDNTVGLYLAIDLGSGSSMNTTAGSWQSGYFRRTSGCVSWVTTNSATFRLTGVQLEAGSVASPFERRPYGTELALCQRYYFKMVSGDGKQFSVGTYFTASLFAATSFFPVTMRTAPSLYYTTGTGYYLIYSNNGADSFDAFGAVRVSETSTGFDTSTGTSGTQGYGGVMVTNNASSYVGFTAEL